MVVCIQVEGQENTGDVSAQNLCHCEHVDKNTAIRIDDFFARIMQDKESKNEIYDTYSYVSHENRRSYYFRDCCIRSKKFSLKKQFEGKNHGRYSNGRFFRKKGKKTGGHRTCGERNSTFS